MPESNKNQGGGDHATHEQHVKAGEQSHKNQGDTKQAGSSGQRGGSHEQHVKAGEQSHKNR